MTQPRDRTVAAPAVLLTIARLSALAVEGVAGMAAVPGGVNRLFKRGGGDGVQIEVDDNSICAKLYLVVSATADMQAVARAVQAEVGRAYQDMVGMVVRGVSVSIEDVDYD
ncbi:MAG: Asp23/Gls24 family envelope stress response protein [Anaerolineales bacterium]|jgi:uncharacterized alkaline shock family protein YloU|nr:Asp23/Gls24 family envelope stress response protein [Anaerolineales bacterium]MDP7643806.1 Asp23/Gls24 family envelope stress response protein [Anaerolineales bacterium]HJN41139.1 Asp23/Gls24 family envelope stress response protein [Anaerolineales bacterium]